MILKNTRFFGLATGCLLLVSSALLALGGKGYENATRTYKWDTGALSSVINLAGNPPRITVDDVPVPNPAANFPFLSALVAQKFDTRHAHKRKDYIKSVQFAFADIILWSEGLYHSQSEPECAGFNIASTIGLPVRIAIWEESPINSDGSYNLPIYSQNYEIKPRDTGNAWGSNMRPLNFNCQAIPMTFEDSDACDISFPVNGPEFCGSCSTEEGMCLDGPCTSCYSCSDPYVLFAQGDDDSEPNNPRCALPHTRRIDYRVDQDGTIIFPNNPNFLPQGSGFSQYPARFTSIRLHDNVEVQGEFWVGVFVDVPAGVEADGLACGGYQTEADFIGVSVLDADEPRNRWAGFVNNAPVTPEHPNPVVYLRSASGVLPGEPTNLLLDEVLCIRAVAQCERTSSDSRSSSSCEEYSSSRCESICSDSTSSSASSTGDDE